MDLDKYLIEEIRHISLSMFNKNFFGVYHGSISARVSKNIFIINKKSVILDDMNRDSLIGLNYLKKDYRWNSASSDSEIHEHIYKMISSAKYISFAMPPYATAYSLKHSKVSPQDYFGKKILGEILIYDPKNPNDWMDRAPYEISKAFKEHNNNLLLIKGFGVIIYDRDITEMAKKISILENSCRLLVLSALL